MGQKEEQLPVELRDSIVKKSKRGPIGSLVLHNMSGMKSNAALRTVRTFEANVGGKEEIAEKLAAVQETLNPQQLELLTLLRSSTPKGLGRLMVESGVEPVAIMGAYAKGCVVLGKIQAAIEAHRNLPGLIKDLYRHALDQETVCKVCVGLGEVPYMAGAPTSKKVPCPQCKGSGKGLISSKHKEFAHRQLLEVTKMVNEKGGTHVEVTQQVAVAGGGKQMGFFERMLDTADNITFPEQKQRIIDAEIVTGEAEAEAAKGEDVPLKAN